MFSNNIKKNDRPETLVRQLATRERTICPALILAISRTVNVRGRIKILTVSIKTRKGTNAVGAPAGAKWAAEAAGLLCHPDNSSNPQSSSANELAVHKLLVIP